MQISLNDGLLRAAQAKLPCSRIRTGCLLFFCLIHVEYFYLIGQGSPTVLKPIATSWVPSQAPMK